MGGLGIVFFVVLPLIPLLLLLWPILLPLLPFGFLISQVAEHEPASFSEFISVLWYMFAGGGIWDALVGMFT